MKKSIELRLRRDQMSERLNELCAKDETSDEERAEMDRLDSDLRENRVKLAAAVTQEHIDDEKAQAEARAEDGLNAEQRARLELRDKSTVSAYFRAAKSGKLEGREAELNQELGFDGNEIPMEIFESSRPDEKRAITAAPGTVGVNLQSIEPYVFAPSIAAGLGIAMPSVPSGSYAIPVITTALTAGARAKGTDQAATAAQFTVHSMTPKQVSARLEFNITDIAAAGTNLEGALRENLSMALSAELDDQIINGDGSAPNLSGLFKVLTDASADATTLTFDHGLAKLADLIDGLWATETMHVRQIVGVDTYRLAAKLTSVPATGGKGELTLADYLKEHSGGFRTNKRMPAEASNKQKAICYRAGMPGLTTAVVPSWGRIMIDDPYSNSAKGQRNVTVHAILGDLKILQADAYAEVEYKVK